MKKAHALLIICLMIFSPTTSFAEESFFFDSSYLLSDEELEQTDRMNLSAVQLFLSRGSLAIFRATDVKGVEKSAAEIIWEAANAFQLNPQFLLALLQREQSLVEDPNPTDDQYDWAMGYAVCDDCAKSDPLIQKFKGFGQQVWYAAERIRTSYLSDLLKRGYTETGIGPGREMTIDTELIVPVNNATAVLYTYTPHLHGNENFTRIWHRWFVADYPSGTLLQDNTTGGIWLIQNALRRPITSRAAFFSRFQLDRVIQTDATTIERYAMGTPIRFPNYALLRSPRGTVYLIVDDERRGFDSEEAFRSHGFSTDEIIDVAWDELNVYHESTPITTASVYPQGTLLQNNQTGGVYFVHEGLKQPIVSRELLKARFADARIVAVAPKNLEEYETADPVVFPDGTVMGERGTSAVYVVENGLLRHVADEQTFLTYGWSWDQIVWTDKRSVELHPFGEELSTDVTSVILTTNN